MRNFLNIALRYYLGPLALYIAVRALGVFTGWYLLITNVPIIIFVFFGLLTALIIVFIWKSSLKALALIFSVLTVVMCGWYGGQDPLERNLYRIEVLMTPHFDEKCGPPGGIPLNDDTLWVCRKYDFDDYAKLIVKISGSYPTERLIDDINSGKVRAPADRDEWWIRPNSVIGHHLISDYYLFEVYLCGRGLLCGPLD